MNPEERKIEAALLSERWKLISSGVDRRDIKFKGYKLLVKGKNMVKLLISNFSPLHQWIPMTHHLITVHPQMSNYTNFCFLYKC